MPFQIEYYLYYSHHSWIIRPDFYPEIYPFTLRSACKFSSFSTRRSFNMVALHMKTTVVYTVLRMRRPSCIQPEVIRRHDGRLIKGSTAHASSKKDRRVYSLSKFGDTTVLYIASAVHDIDTPLVIWEIPSVIQAGWSYYGYIHCSDTLIHG